MADPPVRLPQDLARGRRALSHGCQLGTLAACRTLASYDLDAVGGQVACPAWESICARGDQRSCAFFATCLLYDDRFRHDPQRALAVLTEGCQRRDRVSCRELGYIFRNGKLAAQDLVQAFAFLDYACRQDDPLACSDAGEILEQGRGVARDLERAKTLYRMSCARGIRPRPCAALRRLGEEPPSAVVSTAVTSESNYVSRPFEFEWRLPANWEFVVPPATGLGSFAAAEETVSAQPRAGGPRESLTVGVRDDAAPASFDLLEREGTDWMRSAGFSKTGSSRFSFFYNEALRIDGEVPGPERQFLTLLLFYRGRHRFELRCLTPVYQTGMVCRDAFGAMIFTDLPAVKPAPPKESDRAGRGT